MGESTYTPGTLESKWRRRFLIKTSCMVAHASAFRFLCYQISDPSLLCAYKWGCGVYMLRHWWHMTHTFRFLLTQSRHVVAAMTHCLLFPISHALV